MSYFCLNLGKKGHYSQSCRGSLSGKKTHMSIEALAFKFFGFFWKCDSSACKSIQATPFAVLATSLTTSRVQISLPNKRVWFCQWMSCTSKTTSSTWNTSSCVSRLSDCSLIHHLNRGFLLCSTFEIAKNVCLSWTSSNRWQRDISVAPFKALKYLRRNYEDALLCETIGCTSLIAVLRICKCDPTREWSSGWDSSSDIFLYFALSAKWALMLTGKHKMGIEHMTRRSFSIIHWICLVTGMIWEHKCWLRQRTSRGLSPAGRPVV